VSSSWRFSALPFAPLSHVLDVAMVPLDISPSQFFLFPADPIVFSPLRFSALTLLFFSFLFSPGHNWHWVWAGLPKIGYFWIIAFSRFVWFFQTLLFCGLSFPMDPFFFPFFPVPINENPCYNFFALMGSSSGRPLPRVDDYDTLLLCPFPPTCPRRLFP